MKMNKVIAGIMAVCLMGTVMPAVERVKDNVVITANAENETEYTYENLTYKKYGNYIEISDCDETAETVEIPAEIDGVPVTSIRYNAFCYCSDLTSIVIPESVINIGERAFFSCTGLTSVEIPDSVMSIENGAFYNCTNLISIEIPDSVTSIGGQAFYGTSWLEEKRKENPFVIVNGILIDGYTCSGDVIIPDIVTSIGNDAFRGCSDLTSVNIPDNVTSIENGAFWDCTGLTSIVIPDSVTSIGNSTFGGCSGLTSVEIPDSVNVIGENLFYYCTGLTSVKIPDSVNTIEENAFKCCYSLTSVEIPDSVTSIGWLAFYECENLTSITISNPECKINDNKDTISDTATIYGYENSTAKAYAEKYGMKFALMEKVPEKEISIGDINGDGFIDSVDSSAVLVEYAELSTKNPSTLAEDARERADLNKDGIVDAVDSTIILQYYAYISTKGTDSIEQFISSLDI